MLTPVARSSRYAISSIITPSSSATAAASSAGRQAPTIFLSPLPAFSSHHRLCQLSSQSRNQSIRTVFSITSKTRRRHLISEGRTTTPADDEAPSPTPSSTSTSPFYFETGYSIFAKRPSRAFPPPFVSLPSGSFSDPLTTHNPSRGRRPFVNGQPVRGVTNGDDAIIVGDQNFLAVNDGVGAWAQKERGHAALWSRLIAHFWAVEVEKTFEKAGGKDGSVGQDALKLEDLDPIQNLQVAFEETKIAMKGKADAMIENEEAEKREREGGEASASSSSSSSSSKKEDSSSQKSSDSADPATGNDILGTTTVSSALLYHKQSSSSPSSSSDPPTPVILATSLGDCKVLIIRPSSGDIIYRSTEQWHWFDCPRQLGTNSPDTPLTNAVTDTVSVEPDDLVAVMSDGVTDNLWEHEICTTLCDGVKAWHEAAEDDAIKKDGIVFVARGLMNAAREIAQDPNAESPYMERALDEGLAAEGGKLDDISVLLGIVRKR